MKKEHTIEELKQKAADFLKAKPTVDKVFTTLDGNVFTMENRAKLHAGAKGKVYPFSRADVVTEAEKPEPKQYTLNAKDTVAKIKEAITLEGLAAFADDDRKTVIEALKAKTVELEAAINNDKRE